MPLVRKGTSGTVYICKYKLNKQEHQWYVYIFT